MWIRHLRILSPNKKYSLHIFVDHEVAYMQVDCTSTQISYLTPGSPVTLRLLLLFFLWINTDLTHNFSGIQLSEIRCCDGGL